jgi:hypothetical protein
MRNKVTWRSQLCLRVVPLLRLSVSEREQVAKQVSAEAERGVTAGLLVLLIMGLRARAGRRGACVMADEIIGLITPPASPAHDKENAGPAALGNKRKADEQPTSAAAALDSDSDCEMLDGPPPDWPFRRSTAEISGAAGASSAAGPSGSAGAAPSAPSAAEAAAGSEQATAPASAWACTADAASPLWQKRLPFFVCYFFVSSWCSTALAARHYLRGAIALADFPHSRENCASCPFVPGSEQKHCDNCCKRAPSQPAPLAAGALGLAL